MTQKDEEILDQMTAEFTKLLIQNKPEDLWVYKEFAERIFNLINAEVHWRATYEDARDLMQFWPSEIKN